MKIRPVILCGGAGTRLWPKQKKHPAKQDSPTSESKEILYLENLEKALDLQQRTIEHDRKHFGQTYEMT